jgi:hypothetical protein
VFINYQVLGYMKAGLMVTLQPQRKVSVTALPCDVPGATATGPISDEAISSLSECVLRVQTRRVWITKNATMR